VWDAVTGTHLQTLKGHSDSIRSVSFSPDGTKIASGSSDNTLRVWDAVTGAHLQMLKSHSSSVRSVSFSPDGTKIASESDDKTLRVWDAVTGAHLQTLEGHSDSVWSVSFSPDGTKITSGSSDNTLQVWHAVTGYSLKPSTSKHFINVWPEYYMDGGWLFSLMSKQRMCWVPVAYRGVMSIIGSSVALGTENGLVINLNIKHLTSYLSGL